MAGSSRAVRRSVLSDCFIFSVDTRCPMPQAVVDPEELRQFAQSLKKFNAQLRDRASALGNQLATLSATWRDQEHEKFLREFEQSEYIENAKKRIAELKTTP